MTPRRPRARRSGLAALVAVTAALTLGDCSTDSTDGRASDNSETPLPPPSAVDETIPPDLPPALSTDPPTASFVDDVLQDGAVTADELESAYTGYIQCLGDGGASGVYAWDIALEVGVVTDGLAMTGDDPNGTRLRSLQAECQRDYLGDLHKTYDTAHPQDPADLATRQRDSIVSCVAGVNPDLAANVPDDVTVNTEVDGVATIDLALDPATIGAEGGDLLPVDRCVGSLGAPYHSFP